MTTDHFGKIAVTSRTHATLNSNAYLNKTLTLEEYKNARLISDPIRLVCIASTGVGRAHRTLRR